MEIECVTFNCEKWKYKNLEIYTSDFTYKIVMIVKDTKIDFQ